MRREVWSAMNVSASTEGVLPDLWSIPVAGWWLIALAASALPLVTFPALFAGLAFPDGISDDMRSTLEQRFKKQKAKTYYLYPVICVVILVSILVEMSPVSKGLFFYSTLLGCIPIAVLPVRRRMMKNFVDQALTPDIRVEPDWLATSWCIIVMSTACVGVPIVLL